MTSTGVNLVKNDGSETFVLKVENIENTNSNNIVTHTLVSEIGNIAGEEPLFEKEGYTVDGVIAGTEPADYPNSGTYSNHDYGMSEELRRAVRQWGNVATGGLDTLQWDGRSIGVVIADFILTQDRTADGPRQYTYTLELTSYDTSII
jgi:hypothetical protein